MNVNRSKRWVVLSCISAFVLAGSFLLPVATKTVYLGPDGEPAGFWAQLMGNPDTPSMSVHEFAWEDEPAAPLTIFFLPSVLALLLYFARGGLRRVLTILAPFVAGCLFVVLLALVTFADFGINLHRSYGGYVALTALGCFILATGALAIGEISGWLRKKRPPFGTMAIC